MAYEPELKSLIAISVVLALTVKSFSNDKTNLAAHQSNKISKLIHERERISIIECLSITLKQVDNNGDEGYQFPKENFLVIKHVF